MQPTELDFRLDRIERTLRRTQVFAAVLLLAFGVLLWAVSASAVGKKLPTSKMQLTDQAGRVRIELSAGGDHPYLKMFDTSGVLDLSLGLEGETSEPTLAMYAGRDHRVVGQFSTSAMGASIATLLDQNHQSSITALSVAPVLLFTGGSQGARLDLEKTARRLDFVDSLGRVISSVGRR